MNSISLTGLISNVPRRESIGDLRYTVFELWTPEAYRKTYAEEFSVICVGELASFVQGLRRYVQIEVQGQSRGLYYDRSFESPDARFPVEVFYPRVIANSIRRRNRTVSEVIGDHMLFALDRPEPA